MDGGGGGSDGGSGLAIVGSVELHEHPLAYRIIYEAFDRLEPTILISGGAVGVDTIAEKEAKRRGIETLIYRPKRQAWLRHHPDGFWARNLKIATECDYLIRVSAEWSRTYGSGWTRDQAKLAGKTTEEHVVTRPAATLKVCMVCHSPMTPKLQYTQPHPLIVWDCHCGQRVTDRLDSATMAVAEPPPH
jgi:hypothetical protein